MVAGVAVCWLQVVRNLVCVFGSVSMFAVSKWKWKGWFGLMLTKLQIWFINFIIFLFKCLIKDFPNSYRRKKKVELHKLLRPFTFV